jgi:hypothetical protein
MNEHPRDRIVQKLESPPTNEDMILITSSFSSRGMRSDSSTASVHALTEAVEDRLRAARFQFLTIAEAMSLMNRARPC